MKLVFYDSLNKVIEVVKDVVNPAVDNNNIEWEGGGAITGANLPFLLLEDDVGIDDVVTEELIALDKKSEFPKVDLSKENADLKSRVDLMQKALDDLILGGM